MKQPEEEAQQALYIEIGEEILQQYHRYILRHSPWMKKNIALLFGNEIFLNIQTIIKEFELESLSTAELNEFLQDIRANPKQLHSIFKELWLGPK